MPHSPLLFVLALACTAPPATQLDCDSVVDGDVSAALSQVPSAPVTADLALAGSAHHSAGLAIHRLTAAGVAATADGLSFDTWSVTVPFAHLEGLAQDDVAQVHLEALDACGVLHDLGSLDVELAWPAQVDWLDLQLEIPAGEDHLPADATVSAALTVRANPEATGSTVTLEASLGEVQGDQEGVVTLAGDGQVDASVTVLYSAAEPGTAVLRATSAGLEAAQTVVIAAAPSLVPATVDLSAGASSTLVVLSEGRVVQCRATVDEGLTITSGGVDISHTPAAVDVDADGRVDLVVQAAEVLETEVEGRVDCEDAWGQQGSAWVTAQP